MNSRSTDTIQCHSFSKTLTLSQSSNRQPPPLPSLLWMYAAAKTPLLLREDLHMPNKKPRPTAKGFDANAKPVGRAAAVKQAVAGGATLSSKGRIRFPGGDSRLTSEPGLKRPRRR